ncbi:MAG: glycosyltransferase [Prevotellaceae bacterium]|jgi:glycosyltransferase involved in cell wall biosynthesis|nr:glycosyltransferase [Prevotellaceae bacterium]
MNKHKVSILVPIYNVSEYIERCAHSLFQQTFDDIEYVFVNDCTQDDSVEKLQKVIEQYPNRKSFVKIIHHEKNCGLATTRNTAIDNSTGQYIQVVDSDDWIELDMIEKMYKTSIKKSADIVVCDVLLEQENKTIMLPSLISHTKEEHFFDMLAKKIPIVHWNKLIKRELYELSDCRVPDGFDCGEDCYVIPRIFLMANKIVRVNETLYHYNKYNYSGYLSMMPIIVRTKFRYVLFQSIDDFLKKQKLYDRYIKKLEYIKVADKLEMFIEPNSTYKMRKQFAFMFKEFEMNYFNSFRLGEKLMLFFTHYHFFLCAHIIQKLIVFKNRKIEYK